MQAKVCITIKDGVLDSEGKTILGALHTLAFDSVRNVRAGRLFVLDIDAPDKQSAREVAQKACEVLLANHIIEDYEIEL